MFRTEALELAVFENAENFYLGERTHLGDFVEKNCAAIGQLEFSFHTLLRAGECALLVAEELAFQKCIAHSGRIESDERPRRSGRGIVNRVGQECFSGSGFAKEYHGHVRFRGEKRERQTTFHRRIIRRQVFNFETGKRVIHQDVDLLSNVFAQLPDWLEGVLHHRPRADDDVGFAFHSDAKGH